MLTWKVKKTAIAKTCSSSSSSNSSSNDGGEC